MKKIGLIRPSKDMSFSLDDIVPLTLYSQEELGAMFDRLDPQRLVSDPIRNVLAEAHKMAATGRPEQEVSEWLQVHLQPN